MAKLDITDTAFAGFGVIKRNPLAPAVWGLVQMLLVAAPMALMIPMMAEFITTAIAAEQAGVEPQMSDIMAIQGRMNLISPFAMIAGLVARGLLGGAMFRSVLNPGDRAWFFMRLGKAELMLVVTGIVLSIIGVMALLVAGIIVAIVAVLIGQASTEAGIAVGILGGLAVLIAGLWALLRLSMAFGLSFDRRSFLLFESWPMTRGRTGSLFLIALVSAIVAAMLQALLYGLVFGGLLAGVFGTGALTMEMLQDPARLMTPAVWTGLVPWGLAALLLGSMAAGYLTTLVTAPWAAAYRALAPVADPPTIEPNLSAMAA
ncbi:MAG: hypothetical protein QE280_14905 [Caulobacter sp.]|nr:hypothetical protein [Caulobacter sp.]